VTTGRHALLALGAASYAALMFVWFALPATLQLVVADLGLAGVQAGVLAGAIPLAYVPLSLPSGAVVDRVGPRRAIGAGLVVFGVSGAARAAAPGFPSLLLATVGVGVGGTAITFGLPKLVAGLYPVDRAGTGASVYLLGSYAGTTAAFTLSRPVLVPFLGGWRPLFRLSGVAVLGFAAVWAVAAALAPAGEHGGESLPTREGLRRVVTHPGMRLLVLVGVAYLLLVHGLQGWLATVLAVRGVPEGTAALATGLLVAAQAAGTVVVPALADRAGDRPAAVVGCGALAAAGVVGTVVAEASVPLAAAGVVVAGLGVGGLSPLVRALPVDLDGVGPELTGTAVGLVFAVGEFGGFLGPTLVGAGHDLTGSYAPGLLLLAAGGGIAAAAGAGLRAQA
jgi:cyanate permease